MLKKFSDFSDSYFSCVTQASLKQMRRDTLDKRISLIDPYFTGPKRLEREDYIRRGAKQAKYRLEWMKSKGFA